MNNNTTPAAAAIDRQSSSVVPTRILLIAGAAAGPIFAAVATAQVLLRDGFDLRRHPLSQLATGDLGFGQFHRGRPRSALSRCRRSPHRD